MTVHLDGAFDSFKNRQTQFVDDLANVTTKYLDANAAEKELVEALVEMAAAEVLVEGMEDDSPEANAFLECSGRLDNVRERLAEIELSADEKQLMRDYPGTYEQRLTFAMGKMGKCYSEMLPIVERLEVKGEKATTPLGKMVALSIALKPGENAREKAMYAAALFQMKEHALYPVDIPKLVETGWNLVLTHNNGKRELPVQEQKPIVQVLPKEEDTKGKTRKPKDSTERSTMTMAEQSAALVAFAASLTQ